MALNYPNIYYEKLLIKCSELQFLGLQPC